MHIWVSYDEAGIFCEASHHSLLALRAAEFRATGPCADEKTPFLLPVISESPTIVRSFCLNLFAVHTRGNKYTVLWVSEGAGWVEAGECG